VKDKSQIFSALWVRHCVSYAAKAIVVAGLLVLLEDDLSRPHGD
jgi:hypothetical protein